MALLAAAVLAVTWAGAGVAAAMRAAGEPGFPLDDAWIHVRLARQAAAGEGLRFNTGAPGAASTAPLWTLVLATAARVGAPFPWAAYACGVAGSLLLACGAAALLRRALGDPRAAAAAAILVVTTHPFPWASVSGMEATLAAALTLAVAAASAAGRPAAALGLSALAALTRPELLILPPLVAFEALRRPARRAVVPVLLGTAAACAAPFLVNRALTGAFVAASFAAKVGRHGIVAAALERHPGAILSIIATNVPEYALRTLRALAADNLALLVLSLAGCVRLARRGGTHLPWLVITGLPLAMATLAPFGGPEFHEQRYLAPVVALVVTTGCAGLGWAPGRAGRPILAIGLIVALGLSGAGAWRGMRRYAREVKNITEMQVRVARWLAARPGGPGLVATNDIGAIGALTGAPILDLTGLATPEIIPYLRRPAPPGGRNRGWNGANEAALLEVLRRRRPDHVALFPSWYPSPFFQQALGPPRLRVDLEDNLICGDRTMLVFSPDWDREGVGPNGRADLPRAGRERPRACRTGPEGLSGAGGSRDRPGTDPGRG